MNTIYGTPYQTVDLLITNHSKDGGIYVCEGELGQRRKEEILQGRKDDNKDENKEKQGKEQTNTSSVGNIQNTANTIIKVEIINESNQEGYKNQKLITRYKIDMMKRGYFSYSMHRLYPAGIFVCWHPDRADVVLYVGAASGQQLNLLRLWRTEHSDRMILMCLN